MDSKLKLFIVFLTFCLSLKVSARAPFEGEILSEIISEIEIIEILANKAELASSENSRIILNYANLKRDLNTLKIGIQSRFLPENQEPEILPVIKGDYIEKIGEKR